MHRLWSAQLAKYNVQAGGVDAKLQIKHLQDSEEQQRRQRSTSGSVSMPPERLDSASRVTLQVQQTCETTHQRCHHEVKLVVQALPELACMGQ
jgi:hypothetical protein